MQHVSRSENLAADALAKLASFCQTLQVAVSREVLKFPSVSSTQVNFMEAGTSSWDGSVYQVPTRWDHF